MAKQYVSVESLNTYLTVSGHVMLESDEIDPIIEIDMFGRGGIAPPKSLTRLFEDMLRYANAAPDEADAAELRITVTVTETIYLPSPNFRLLIACCSKVGLRLRGRSDERGELMFSVKIKL